jgi:putative DNA primase/helicase
MNTNGAALLPQHLADLRRSGLSDKTVAACRFYSETNPVAVAAILGWPDPATALGPCLVIPFAIAAGNGDDYARVKPDRPRADKKDGKVKYESPRGKGNHAYFPPATRKILADVSVPLLMTEGEKKAAKADQEGFRCIGITGVYSWQVKQKDKGKPRELIADLKGIAWKGRPVFIVFDSDLANNPLVRWAEWHLAQALTAQGAVVKVVRLPAGPDGAKVGLDDYLMAHGAGALRKLLDEAGPAKEPVTGETGNGVVEAEDDPHRLARLYRVCFQTVDIPSFYYWREDFVRWENGAYRVVKDREVRAELTGCIKAEFDRLNRVAVLRARAMGRRLPKVEKVHAGVVGNACQALASMSLLPATRAAPSWLGDEPFPAGEVLACRNGLVHLPSLVAGREHFVAPTPRFFSPNVLGYNFDLQTPAPSAWLAFLAALWGNDRQPVEALQEWFGYTALPDTSQQKILLVVGPRRSGKGTIGRVLTQMIGVANVCAPTLGSLTGPFGLQPLLGKTLAVISDARLSRRTDAAVVVERLLSISGEDSQTVERKYQSSVTGKLPVRFVILTNELPRIDDPSGALVSRLVVLRLTESWFGREDVRLTDRLLGELPGILLWSIEGWRRLRERGCFVQPKASAQLVTDLEDLASPIGAFLRERCELRPDHEVEVQLLYGRWKAWCEGRGIERPGSEQMFGRNLRAAVPYLDIRQARDDGERCRIYTGIRLKPP